MNEVVTYTYDSWGKLLNVGGSLASTVGQKNPYRYRGYRYDSETGLYYLQSRYYDPNVGRFINADDTDQLDANKDHVLQQNLFVYCLNNPVNHADPSGNWILDAIFLAVDVATAISHPSLGNVAWVLLDVVCLADPTDLASAGSHVLKAAHAAEETVHAVDEARHVKSFTRAASEIGRAGKQAKLRELGHDQKVSSALRGEIKRDINQIKRGKRKSIRVPKGYNLAHRRGYEARKGYGYKYSDLQNVDLHRLQHKHEGYRR